jgi:hypothetical protein
VGISPRLRATDSYCRDVFEAHDAGVSQRKLSITHRFGSAPSSAGISHALNKGYRSCRAEAPRMRQTKNSELQKNSSCCFFLLFLYACLSKNLSLPRKASSDTCPRRLMLGMRL